MTDLVMNLIRPPNSIFGGARSVVRQVRRFVALFFDLFFRYWSGSVRFIQRVHAFEMEIPINTMTKPEPGDHGGCNTFVRSARNSGIDAIKGGAILLVVLGHAIQSKVSGFENNLLFRIIYSFHMPLFMILSGWFAAPEKIRKLKRTAIRLVLPVCSWYLILYVVEMQYRTIPFVEYVKRWIISPDVGLWFLWVLFLCHLWLVPVRRLEAWIGLAAYFVGGIVLCAIPISALGLKLTKYYFLFFAIGYLAARYWKYIVSYSRVAIAVSLLMYSLAFHYWHFKASGLPPLRVVLAGHQFDLTWYLFISARLVCAVSGSVLFAYLVAKLVVHSPAGVLFAWLGTLTLEYIQFISP